MSKHILSLIAPILLMADTEGSTAGPAAVVDGREFSFTFKTVKVKDEEGKEIGDGRKHPNFKAVLPVPQPTDLIDFLGHYGETEPVDPEDAKKGVKPTVAGKVAALIVEAIQDLPYQAARAQINDFLEKDPKATFTPTNFSLEGLTLEYIAQLERGSRGAWAPSDDDMKIFNEDYTMIMVQEVNYDPKRVKVHCEQYAKGFVKIKGDKIALGKMKEFLTGWAARTQNMEENTPVYEWLQARLDKYLKAEEKNFADAL